MNQSIRLYIFMILFPTLSNSFEIAISCGPNGNLISQKVSASILNQSIQAELIKGIRSINQVNKLGSRVLDNTNRKDCFEESDDSEIRSMALITESNSRSRIWSTKPGNKNSWYDKNIIKSIIREAVRNGIDPYLALAISINENPPYISKSISNSLDYGRIGGSMNGRAIANVFGCSTFNTPEQLGSAVRVTKDEITQNQ